MLCTVGQIAHGDRRAHRTEVLPGTDHRSEEAPLQHREDGLLHLRQGTGLDQCPPVVVLDLEQPQLEPLPGLVERGPVEMLPPLRRGSGSGAGGSPGAGLGRLGRPRRLGIQTGQGAAQLLEGVAHRGPLLGNHRGIEVEYRADPGPCLLPPALGERGVGQVVVPGGLEARGGEALQRPADVLGPQLGERLGAEARRHQDAGEDRDRGQQRPGGQRARGVLRGTRGDRWRFRLWTCALAHPPTRGEKPGTLEPLTGRPQATTPRRFVAHTHGRCPPPMPHGVDAVDAAQGRPSQLREVSERSGCCSVAGPGGGSATAASAVRAASASARS